MNPSGLCKCGCGLPTTVSLWNDRSKGYLRGMPRDYRHGHIAKTPAHKQIVSPHFDVGRDVRHAQSKLTRKLGPYKAGRTVMVKAAVGKIEAAMRRNT